jgi:hypothetical protein
MTELLELSQNDGRFEALIEAAVRDNFDRAKLWMDMAYEFAHLGLTVMVLRGDPIIARHAQNAVDCCVAASRSELDKADRVLAIAARSGVENHSFPDEGI